MLLRLQLLLCVALCLGLPTVVSGQLTDLASQVHRGSNAIVAIDAAAVQSTQLAQQEGWTQKFEQAYVDRAVFLPPEADKLLIASHLVPQEDFRQAWEVAVMTLTEPFSMRAIARAEGGYVDEISGKEAVWSPSNAYLVGLEDQTLGIVFPAHRQAISRWIDDISQDRTNRLSAYLQSALARVTPETQIVMAIDLKDVPSPHRVEDRLKNSQTLENSSVQLNDVVSLVQSIRGATIEVSIDTKARATSRIEFAQPVNMPDVIAKRIVLETLDSLGIHLDDLAEHEYRVTGQSIIVDGELSSSGLRRLFSLLEIPTTKFSELEEEVTETSTPSAGHMAENSQTYFKSVTTLLDDLRRDRSKQDTRGGMDAVWMERYARKIDRLPILYVDEDLLDYGASVAVTLRNMAGFRRGAGLSAGSQKSALRTGGGYGNYSYGYRGAGYRNVSGATANTKDRQQIDRQLQNQATSARTEGWRQIENATAQIRREMTMRYGVEF